MEAGRHWIAGAVAMALFGAAWTISTVAVAGVRADARRGDLGLDAPNTPDAPVATTVGDAGPPARDPASPPALTAFPRRTTFAPGPEPQPVAVTGTGFRPGQTATIVTPWGRFIRTYGPAALVDLTPASFTLDVVLDGRGTYRLSVRSPDGQRSNAIPIVVR
ncbi:MAG: hypothetical protein R2752_15300 [Vicinamibacterales bacterium]